MSWLEDNTERAIISLKNRVIELLDENERLRARIAELERDHDEEVSG
jgi:prefoldin subunit 5